MINSIIESISVALNAEFGDSYLIHPENVKQGLKEPCFFIQCIEPSHSLFLGMYQGNRRYKRENLFCIHYFPENKQNARTEIHSVCERLELCLEWITNDGDLIMGTKMHYEIVDDVLLFFVNYDLFVTVRHEEEVMEEYTLNSSVRKLN